MTKEFDAELVKNLGGQVEVELAWDKQNPLNVNAPLPLELDTLEFVEPEHRVKYVRERNGKFSLYYINLPTDQKSYEAYAELIAATGAKKLRTFPDGVTPYSRQMAAINSEKMAKDVLDMVNKRAADARAAKIDAQRANNEAAIKARYGE
ncbi:MAG TPA: hypothetical protein VHE78_04705 [Gemmatimonadaceae bacterium]|nr:hypothetical protein [Gemmatimonadaceae bacterium]